MPYIPQAVCAQCDRPMKPLRNGQTLEAILPNGRSYYKVDADEYICPGCQTKIFIGFSREAIEAHDDRYESILADHAFSLPPF